MANYIQKDISRRKLVAENEYKRLQYKAIINNMNIPKEIRYNYIQKLNKLNRNTSETRIRNRCVLTGRGRGVYKMFRLSRLKFRELAGKGIIPGVRKSSW